MMCSSSERFILCEYSPTLLGRENATKWTGLTQTTRPLVGAGQEFQNLFQSPMVKDFLPFKQDLRGRGLPLLNPSIQRGLGPLK